MKVHPVENISSVIVDTTAGSSSLSLSLSGTLTFFTRCLVLLHLNQQALTVGLNMKELCQHANTAGIKHKRADKLMGMNSLKKS